MPQGLQAVLALVVLLPGFVSARIVRMMCARSQQTELERVIEALIFSFFTYVVYVFLWGTSLPIEWHPAIVSVPISLNVSVFRWRLASLAVIAIVLGFGWGYIKGRDILLHLLRRLGVTQRSSRESVWLDVFMNFGGTVQVGLGDGRTVVGWLKQYAETSEERTLFLERAYWVLEDFSSVDVPGDGMILLTEKSEIKYVMFLDKGK